jgi:hypothetical protein
MLAGSRGTAITIASRPVLAAHAVMFYTKKLGIESPRGSSNLV